MMEGSALSPLLFIMVMSLISGKVSEQEELKKILYADDLAVVADNKEDLQKTLQTRTLDMSQCLLATRTAV